MEDRREPVPPLSPNPDAVVRVPDHELIRLIGRGSYGEVWLARNTLGTCRAVKIVYEKTFRHKRPFDREFNGVQKFEPISRSHEGLMDVLQVGRHEAGGYFYYVMELADDVVSGRTFDPEKYSPRTLAHDAADHRRLPIEECRRVGVAIATALHFLHGHGLIHRDIKPSNIVFVNGIPKLADIGLVAEMSEARSYVGTEGFIPPEGPGTVQSDLYSLGKVLYEISTGKDRHEYPDLPSVTCDAGEERQLFELNGVILKACRPDPRQRYKSAAAMADDLLSLSTGRRRLLHRRPVRVAIRSGALLAGLGAIAAMLWLTRLKPSAAIPSGGIASGPLAAAKNSAPVAAPAGLVGWWRGQGGGQDSAGNNPANVDDAGFGLGKVGEAFSFDGKPHRVVVPDAPELNFGTNDFSIEVWVQPLPAGPSMGLMTIVDKRFHKSARLSVGYELALFEGKVHFLLTDGISESNGFGDSGPDLRDGHFHHVAVTVRRGSKTGGRLYVDGRQVLVFDPTRRPGDISTAEAVCIGHSRFPGFDTFFNGMIDELSLYGRALSAEEIQSIYDAGSAGKRSEKINAGSFAPRIDFATDSGAMRVAVADFDGDHRPDVVVGNCYANNMGIYRNVGTNGNLTAATFDLPVYLAIGKGRDSPYAVATVDLDRDGKMDLLALDSSINSVAVYRNISDGGTLALAPPVFFPTGNDPRDFACGDLDGDGRPEIVTANFGGGTISILRNAAAAGTIDANSFAARTDVKIGPNVADVGIGDLDGDGKPDLAVACTFGCSLFVLRNTMGPGVPDQDSFSTPCNLSVPTNTMCVVIGDVDGDGKADLVTGSFLGAKVISVYRNVAAAGSLATASFAPRIDFPTGGWVHELALADFNQDGKPDIVTGTESPTHVSVFQNVSAPGVFTTNSLAPRVDLPAGWNAWGTTAADLNGDGLPDIVFVNMYSATLSIYPNIGPFQPRAAAK